MALQQFGLLYTEVGKAAFITGLYIVFVPVISALRGRGSSVTLWLAVFLAVLEVSPRCYCQILGSGTTSGKSLGNTRTTLQINHKVEEVECFSFFFPFYHLFCQCIIFCKKLWQVFLTDGIIICLLCHNRLYGNLLKPKVCQMQYILGKI